LRTTPKQRRKLLKGWITSPRSGEELADPFRGPGRSMMFE
jgi:hypothetical protein